MYETTRLTAEELKKIYEERLSQQEEEHESEVRSISDKNEKEIEKLRQKVQDLKHSKNKLKNELEAAEEEARRCAKLEEEKEALLQECRQKLKEALNQVDSVRNDHKSLEELIKKKEKKMQEYKYQVGDLQKSKVRRKSPNE